MLNSSGEGVGCGSLIDVCGGSGAGEAGFAGGAGGVWANATLPASIPVTINPLKKVFISAPFSLLPRQGFDVPSFQGEQRNTQRLELEGLQFQHLDL
jgi:hypothetical protein